MYRRIVTFLGFISNNIENSIFKILFSEGNVRASLESLNSFVLGLIENQTPFYSMAFFRSSIYDFFVGALSLFSSDIISPLIIFLT